jgi:dihydroorotate dehydrogenase
MKRDLYFAKPLINAAGSLGFAPDVRSLDGLGILDRLGAFVTHPLSLRPRLPAARPLLIEFPGGFLLHTGLPNPGFSEAVNKYSDKWSRSDLPIIVHLMADRPEEAQKMVRALENTENVMAAQLGFAPLLADDILALTVEMCLGEIPLIVALHYEQVLRLGPRLIQEGAAAISLAPPRGALPLTPNPSHPGRGESLVTGRLYGQSLFPRALDAVRSAAMIGLPVIGAGGVWTDTDIESMLRAGAMAVEADARLWVPDEAGDVW